MCPAEHESLPLRDRHGGQAREAPRRHEVRQRLLKEPEHESKLGDLRRVGGTDERLCREFADPRAINAGDKGLREGRQRADLCRAESAGFRFHWWPVGAAGQARPAPAATDAGSRSNP